MIKEEKFKKGEAKEKSSNITARRNSFKKSKATKEILCGEKFIR